MEIFLGLYFKKSSDKNSGRKSQVFWGKYLKEGHREFGVGLPGMFFLQKAL